MTQTKHPTVPTRRRRGTGSIRERRLGVFEIRVPAGVDPLTHRTRQVSHTVHGTRAEAEAMLERLLAATAYPSACPPAALLTLEELLRQWLEADHPWKPSTLVGYRSVARFLRADALGRRRAQQLLPADARAAMNRWRADGASDAVVAARFRTLRAALGWAYTERLIDEHPLRLMRGPRRATPRRPLTDDDVRTLLTAAEALVLEAIANEDDTFRRRARRHRAEQDLLLIRLAADSGARRGELAALRIDDLDGSKLTIERAESAGELTPPKSGHGRCLTIGPSSAGLWERLVDDWTMRIDGELGPWLFSADPAHRQRLGATALGHRFADLRATAGVPQATLHRLRHSVATFLVTRGQVLQAQARLGHADAATTLREYAYALPLTDQNVALAIEQHLDRLDEPCAGPVGSDAEAQQWE